MSPTIVAVAILERVIQCVERVAADGHVAGDWEGRLGVGGGWRARCRHPRGEQSEPRGRRDGSRVGFSALATSRKSALRVRWTSWAASRSVTACAAASSRWKVMPGFRKASPPGNDLSFSYEVMTRWGGDVRRLVPVQEGADVRRASESVRCRVSRSCSRDLLAPPLMLTARWKPASCSCLSLDKAATGGGTPFARSFVRADRAVHHREESNDGTHETKSAQLRRR